MERVLKRLLRGGRFVGVPSSRSRVMSAIRGRNTKTTERTLRMFMVRVGMRGWRLHVSTLVGKPDFLFPAEKVVVFVDGCFWHACQRCGHVPRTRTKFWRAKLERNRHRDHRVTRVLRAGGYRVIRVWEHCLSDVRGRRAVVGRIQRACAEQRYRIGVASRRFYLQNRHVQDDK